MTGLSDLDLHFFSKKSKGSPGRLGKVKLGSKRKLRNIHGEVHEVKILSKKGVKTWNKNKPKTFEDFEKLANKHAPDRVDTRDPILDFFD